MGCPYITLRNMVHGRLMLYGDTSILKSLLCQLYLKLFLPSYIPSLAVWWIFHFQKQILLCIFTLQALFTSFSLIFNLLTSGIYSLSKFVNLFPLYSLWGIYLTLCCFQTFGTQHKLSTFFGLGFVTLKI